MIFNKILLLTLLVTFAFPLTIHANTDYLEGKPYHSFLDLNGAWSFKKDPINEGEANSWFQQSFDRSDWTTVQVPGVWDEPQGLVGNSTYIGAGWYHKSFNIPAEWNQRLVLYSLGAQLTTKVWLNGQFIGEHIGGYTPFEMNLSGIATVGATNELTIRIDNITSDQTIPYHRRAWQIYGGLTREIYILHQPHVRAQNLATSTTLLSGDIAELNIRFEMINDAGNAFNNPVSITLYEIIGTQQIQVRKTIVNTATPSNGIQQLQIKMNLPDAQLWSPENPQLYSLKIEWDWFGNQQNQITIGLQELRWSGPDFLLNGQPLWMQGFGWHEQLIGHGSVLPAGHRLKQLRRMKEEFNCNSIRPGHYTMHPEFYKLCNELGFLVTAEIPAWQIPTATLDNITVWERWLEPQLMEMVTSLRNHPCIAFWGVSNESHFAYTYFNRARELLHTQDNSRPVAPVMDSDYDQPSWSVSDMGARNQHFGWYHSNSVYELNSRLQITLGNSGGRPVWVMEMGALADRGVIKGYGGDITYPNAGAETYQAKVLSYDFQFLALASEQICGNIIWSWHDFFGDGNRIPHGIMDENFKPKLAAYAIRNNLEGDLRLFILENKSLFNPGEQLIAGLGWFNPLKKPQGNFRADWCIMNGVNKRAAGSAGFFSVIDERIGAAGNQVQWNLSPAEPSGLHTLWVQMYNESGEWVYTNGFHFDVGSNTNNGSLFLKVHYRNFNIRDAYLEITGIRIPIYVDPGLIIPLPAGNYAGQCVIKAKGYKDKPLDFSITNSGITELNIEMEKESANKTLDWNFFE